jgi:hypothetical protein
MKITKKKLGELDLMLRSAYFDLHDAVDPSVHERMYSPEGTFTPDQAQALMAMEAIHFAQALLAGEYTRDQLFMNAWYLTSSLADIANPERLQTEDDVPAEARRPSKPRDPRQKGR